jgi:hypothetical protein
MTYKETIKEKKLKNNIVKIGQHCWATLDDKLLVVLKVTKNTYVACGAWECSINAESLTLINIINRPPNHQLTTLYYL